MKKFLLLVAVVVSAITANAQRTVDIQTTLLTPTNGQTIRSGQQFSMSFSITNLGPDEVKIGDTLRVFWFEGNNYTGVSGNYVFPDTLEVDSSVTLFLNNLVKNGTTASTVDECVVGILWNRGTDMVIDTLITDANNKSCASINFSVGIQELLGGKGAVKMYPNPVATEGTISYNLVNSNSVSVKVLDLTGRVIATVFEGQQDAGEQTVKFNTETLANGIYLYEISIDGESHTEKFIVNK